jgi:hypothetical protein
LDGVFEAEVFVEVGDAEEGESELVAEAEDGVEESADGGGVGVGAEEGGEWVEDEESGVGAGGEVFEEPFVEGGEFPGVVGGAWGLGGRDEVEVVAGEVEEGVFSAGGLETGDECGIEVVAGEDDGGGGAVVGGVVAVGDVEGLGARGVGEGGRECVVGELSGEVECEEGLADFGVAEEEGELAGGEGEGGGGGRGWWVGDGGGEGAGGGGGGVWGVEGCEGIGCGEERVDGRGEFSGAGHGGSPFFG